MNYNSIVLTKEGGVAVIRMNSPKTCRVYTSPSPRDRG